MRRIICIEREKHTDAALRRIEISQGPVIRCASEGSIVLGFAVFAVRETMTEAL
jgi:hypothetical protein